MIVLKVITTAKTDKRSEFIQTIQPLVTEIGGETGCVSCRCSQDIVNENYFHVISKWLTKADLEAHCKRENFSVLMGAVEILCESSQLIAENT